MIDPRLLEEARSLDLATTDGKFRLGDLADRVASIQELADALGLSRDQLSTYWFVARRFPPERRHPDLDWSVFHLLRLRPDRFQLIELAGAHVWTYGEVEDRLLAEIDARSGRLAARQGAG